MTTYYVDPSATGLNDGTSWTDAWTDVQTAFDTAVAGDTVYCRGTQTLTTAIVTDDTNEGSQNLGHIKFVGCNASGINDGTRFVLDGNNVATNCLSYNTNSSSGSNYIHIENFEVKNATADGFGHLGGVYNKLQWVLHNVSSHNNGRYGFDLSKLFTNLFLCCGAYLNGSDGFYRPSGPIFFSRSHNNVGHGFEIYSCQTSLIGCISDHNGGHGFGNVSHNAFLFNCTADANSGDGIYFSTVFDDFGVVIGSRVTNHSGVGQTGVNLDGLAVFGWNYFENNTGDNLQGGTANRILYNGSDTNLEDQSDTNQGYTSTTDPEDYNLSSDATLRRTAITIPED